MEGQIDIKQELARTFEKLHTIIVAIGQQEAGPDLVCGLKWTKLIAVTMRIRMRMTNGLLRNSSLCTPLRMLSRSCSLVEVGESESESESELWPK